MVFWQTEFNMILDAVEGSGLRSSLIPRWIQMVLRPSQVAAGLGEGGDRPSSGDEVLDVAGVSIVSVALGFCPLGVPLGDRFFFW